MTPANIILFCYAFIVGIALAMLRPVGVATIAPVALLGALAAATAAYAFARNRRAAAGDPRWRRLALAALALCGIAFGHARYLGQLHVPDRRLGEIRWRGDAPEWRAIRPLDGRAKLLALRAPNGTGDHPVTLRFEGELHARQPERDAAGRPRMDADGRWRLIEVRVPQQAEVTLPARLPRGAVVEIEPPFSTLARIRRIGGDGEPPLTVIQRPTRVAAFARTGRDTTPVEVLGRIANDPDVYPFQTVLRVSPDLIQYQPGGPFFEIERGSIRVTLPEDLPGYAAFAHTGAYGRPVWIRGELLLPPAALNPGAFSQRQFLLSQNIEGQMLLRAPRGGVAAPIAAIAPEGRPPPRGNPLVRFSLALRDDLLRVIKQTSPYPNSAFIAAVTLGLRYGMHNTETLHSAAHADLAVPPLVPAREGDAPLIRHEFRAAGINHVLAVSGLHVTIITALFVGLFTLLRISRRAYVPVVVLILIVFAIITGARPSTIRAVIMNSLFLITWAYLNHTLRASVLLGVPVAAALILLQNPALLVDPSFTLSFGAILSLALLTQPAYDALSRFRGNDLLWLGIGLAGLTAALLRDWLLVTSARFWLLFAPLMAGLFAAGRWAARRGGKLIGDFGFENLPSTVAVFLAAQLAIQIGMMAPLSGFYFQRWASGGAYANLIAIPLIGVILQLALLAGILGLIPVVGLYAALLLNAANWIFSTLFILLGHYTAAWFPFPFVRKPTLRGLALYYAALAVIVWRAPLRTRLHPHWERVPRAARRGAALATVVALAAGLVGRAFLANRPDGRLRVTVFAVNYGSAVFIRTPGGANVLVDTGHVQRERSRRNEAEWTILPHLASRGIRRLDILALTAPAPERTLGAASCYEHLRVRRIVRPPDGVDLRGDEKLRAAIDRRTSSGFWSWLADTRTVVISMPTGLSVDGRPVVLWEEARGGVPFRIEALCDPSGGGAPHPVVLRVSHGDFAMLLPSDLSPEQQRDYLARPELRDWLRAKVVVAPARGVYFGESDAAWATLREFLTATGAERIIFEFGNPRPVLGTRAREAIASHGRSRRLAEDLAGRDRVYVTDRDGAIVIESDGRAWSLRATAGDRSDDEEEPGALLAF